GGNKVRVGQAGEPNKEDAVAKVPHEFFGNFEGKARLADPAGAGQGQQADRPGSKELAALLDLLLSPDQRRRRSGQVDPGSRGFTGHCRWFAAGRTVERGVMFKDLPL